MSKYFERYSRLYEKDAEMTEKTEGTALYDAAKGKTEQNANGKEEDSQDAERRKCTYMVGDRKFDIIGAKAEGVISVGVTYGYGSEEELLAEQPDFLAHSVDELRKFFCS